jgi:hypothetical protein
MSTTGPSHDDGTMTYDQAAEVIGVSPLLIPMWIADGDIVSAGEGLVHAGDIHRIAEQRDRQKAVARGRMKAREQLNDLRDMAAAAERARSRLAGPLWWAVREIEALRSQAQSDTTTIEHTPQKGNRYENAGGGVIELIDGPGDDGRWLAWWHLGNSRAACALTINPDIHILISERPE